MDWKFHIGISIGLLLAGLGSMGMICQDAGLALLVTCGVWFFLFVNPKSPIRGKCWHNSSLGVKLVSELNYCTYGYCTKPSRMKSHIRGYAKVLRGDVDIISSKGEIVNSIEMKLGGELLKSNWEPQELDLKDCLEVKFFEPDYIKPGRYKSHIVISNKNGKAKSPPFEAEIPVNQGE